MSDTVSVNRRATSLDVAPEFDGYSGIIINVDDETQIRAGDTSENAGRVLEMDNPQGTQEMADKLIEKLQGRQYQPYKAEGALLDPAAEMGDGVSIKDTYGGIYSKVVTFSRLMAADISAPTDEEIDHEYKYESPQEKKTKRELGDIRATMIVQSNEIAAKVEKDGGTEGTSSFWWKLHSDEWSVGSGNTTVFSIYDANKDQAGKPKDYKAKLEGEIIAKSGTIGGFTISATAIYKNLEKLGSTAGSGVYIGTDGIQLGQNFKVTSSGYLTANSGTFKGTIHAGKIISDNENDRINGDNLLKKGSIGGGGGGALSGGVLGGVNGGKNFAAMLTRQYTADWLICNNLIISGGRVKISTIDYVDPGGSTRSVTVLAL